MAFDPNILHFLDQETNQYHICKMAAEGLTNGAIASELGFGAGYVRSAQTKARKLAIKRGYAPEYDMYHPTADGFFVKGISTLYGDEGQIKQQWVKTDVDKEHFIEEIKEVVQELVQSLPQFDPVPYDISYTSDELMAVYPLGDPHIGMMALKDEAGVDWDLKRAQEIMCGVFDRLVKTTPNCEQAVIVNLGDYFHYDNASKVTERNRHSLDTDGTYLDMADTGLKIMIQMINSALEHHQYVKVITACGNHDDTGSMFLQAALKHIFAFEERVTIDTTASVFQYFRHGKCFIGVHHGHTAKADKLPLIMASDRPVDWGESAEGQRYWLTGHIHHDSKKEYAGCTVESFRTMAASDKYAYEGGWRSGSDSKALVLHKEFGEVERHTINVAQVLR